MTRDPKARMMQLAALVLCIFQLHGVAPQTTASAEPDATRLVDANLAEGHTTLNDMFREVEKLMEDTQHKLEEAVYKMDNESAKSMLYVNDLPSNYQEESSAERAAGNQSVRTGEVMGEVTDNSTGTTHFSRSLIQPDGRRNQIDRECLIDEDCSVGHYCLYDILQSRCLPCKTVDAVCTKDEECCAGQLCVWGQCSENSSKGEAGTICQCQSQCRANLCCAFHKALLFPVCTGRPLERERCRIPSNHLNELQSWDMEGEGPREYCPCAAELECQPLGRGSLCLRPQNSSSEDQDDASYSETDYIV
ncbi:dickkopf-related protein 3a [Brienomyrus brachyistius]|uniref:dickkopf-related protein 3a n=1 Tax=Brienomyrus brachyistius TaxID=42636 RepID=UPI0020B31B5A|nr:dickkopf-related protein 3a [Brienomyrus brachyistius]